MISRGFRGLLPVALLWAFTATIGCSGSGSIQGREQVSGILDGYARAMKSGDYSTVPFTPDVRFVGPLTDSALVGEAQVKAFLMTVSTGVADIRVKRQIIDGEFASVIAELETKEGTVVPFSEFFRVVGGRIAEIRPYFDPRPLIR